MLGKYYDAWDIDRAVHRFLAPVEKRIPGFTRYIFDAISEFVFHYPDVQRIVGDPDIENEKQFIACKQAGYSFGKVIYLPHKTAQLVFLSRETFMKSRRLPPRLKKNSCSAHYG